MNEAIASFKKNSSEEVIVTCSNYKGCDVFDIRVWVKNSTNSDKIATKKGITLPLILLPELKQAIVVLEKEVNNMEHNA